MSHQRRLDRAGFVGLLETMAEGWNTGDAGMTAACLTEDVHYADPTRYRFDRREDVLPFFQPPPEGHRCVWHRILFDEGEQAGVVEYTYVGSSQYHGAALIYLRDGLVAGWREWQHISEVAWERFVEGPDSHEGQAEPEG